jgi:predicted metal-binding protein
VWNEEDEPMLISAPSDASLVVCSTCRFAPESRTDSQGRLGGALFADALAAELATHPCRDRVDIQPMPCLFACGSHCTVYVRSMRRLGYILGRFSPSPRDARAVLDYLTEYLTTADGVVPYARWPEGVKGHFLVRVPPEGHIWEPQAQASKASITVASSASPPPAAATSSSPSSPILTSQLPLPHRIEETQA